MRPSDTKLKQTAFRLCSKCNRLHAGVTTCPSCESPLQLIDYSFFLSKTLGKYTIKEVLGAGGMGIVFQALHTTLDKIVALKIFIPGSDSELFEKRFLREARILAGLKHSNIIEVYDFEISQWGTPYYVMEYLEGETLGDVIKKSCGGLPLQLFSDYLEPVIQALNHAHKKGIVHRDLKPENIFIEEIHGKKVLKILDFGIAKSVKRGEEAVSLTASETVLGTPFYLAPEQVLNENIGPHTDQYALALIVAEMLSGEVVRGSKNIGEILYTEVHKPIRFEDALYDKIPEEVQGVLVKATMPNPSNRFPDIQAFGTALLEALGPKTESIPTVQSALLTAPIPEPKKDKEPPPVKRKSPTTAAKHPSRKEFISTEEEARLQAKKKQMLWLGIAAASVLLVLIIAFVLRPFDDKSPKPLPPVKPDVEAQKKVPKLKPFATLKKAIDAPGQAVSILTYQDDTFVLQGSGGIYLVDVKKTGSFEQRPLDGKILMGLPGGNVAFIDAYRNVIIQNFIDGTSGTVLLRNPPGGELFKLSKSNEYFAVKKRSSLKLYQIVDRDSRLIKSITLQESTAGFGLELGSRYLIVSGGGKITGYLLDSRQEILKQDFDAGEAATIALQDAGDLMAAAGKGGKVYIYNLKKGTLIHTVSKPGKILALGFFPGKPVLVISKEGKLFFLDIPGKTLGVYEESGSGIIDIAVTDHRLVALDKGAGKIKLFSVGK